MSDWTLSKCDTGGCTALHAAAEHNLVAEVEALVDLKADIGATDQMVQQPVIHGS